MNNSFISNRTFSNLNFCRPERFSYRKKKKKLSIKKEGGFTIYKTEKPIQKLESSNINITFAYSLVSILPKVLSAIFLSLKKFKKVFGNTIDLGKSSDLFFI